MKQIFLDSDACKLRAPARFEADFISSGNCSLKLCNPPRVDSRMKVGIIQLLETLHRQVLVFQIIFADYIHQGTGILKIEHDLSCFCALQCFVVEFPDRQKYSMHW